MEGEKGSNSSRFGMVSDGTSVRDENETLGRTRFFFFLLEKAVACLDCSVFFPNSGCYAPNSIVEPTRKYKVVSRLLANRDFVQASICNDILPWERSSIIRGTIVELPSQLFIWWNLDKNQITRSKQSMIRWFTNSRDEVGEKLFADLAVSSIDRSGRLSFPSICYYDTKFTENPGSQVHESVIVE